MKNIVLCCDGTANEFKRDRTNVVKLYYALAHDFGHKSPTITLASARWKLLARSRRSRKVTKILGLAVGYGLEADVRDAYVFLMNNFADGDRVFLFGFKPRRVHGSRSSVAATHVRLIPAGNEPLVPCPIL